MQRETIAIFENTLTGYRVALNLGPPTGNNNLRFLWTEELDYSGLYAAGATRSMSLVGASIWQAAVRDGSMRVVETAHQTYHCWHLCFCADCARTGGRVWEHSQASWDDHLRHVASNRVFTFPTARRTWLTEMDGQNDEKQI